MKYFKVYLQNHIGSLDNQLASILLTTCSRLVIIKSEQSMQTHPDIGLMTARQQSLTRLGFQPLGSRHSPVRWASGETLTAGPDPNPWLELQFLLPLNSTVIFSSWEMWTSGLIANVLSVWFLVGTFITDSFIHIDQKEMLAVNRPFVPIRSFDSWWKLNNNVDLVRE